MLTGCETMLNLHPRRAAFLVILALGLSTAFIAHSSSEESKVERSLSNKESSKEFISNYLTEKLEQNDFPEKISFTTKSKKQKKLNLYNIEYTLVPSLQNKADELLKKYRPDYAAIVMMDAQTGEILAMTSFDKKNTEKTNLALRASYPAASIFKVITAATAVDHAGVSPEHRIAFNGGNYTLYKKNVLSDRITRWTRFITLKEAFARSINTAFGRLSLETLEPSNLSDYADRFYFNKEIKTDFSFDKSNATVPKEKGYALTQVASGYNRHNTLSPVHGAMIASTIINDGQMPIPYLVKSISNSENEVLYFNNSTDLSSVISESSSEKVKEMMEQTVLNGTSRKSFKKLVRDKKFREIEMGGKTGHFSGTKPRGRNDWFIGYASDGEKKIAIAAITVNVKQWTIKSSAIGETMFREYFKNKL